MDGTLLGDYARVSPRNLAALHAAHLAGIEIVIATGRRHSYAMRVLRPLALHHANPLISSNGTVTRTLGSPTEPSLLIARTHLPHATALWLCAHLRGTGDDDFRNALVLTFDRVVPHGPNFGDDTRGALVVEHLDQLHSSIGRWMAANEPYLAHINPIELALGPSALALDPESTHPNTHTPEAPIQAMLCGTLSRMARAESRLLQHPSIAASGHPSGRSATSLGGPSFPASSERVGCLPQSNLTAPDPTPLLTLHRTEYPDRDLSILDILPSGCSKGAALLALAAARNIEPSEVLAIGDNWNDVSMLEAAGSAILMANAPEDLKALALSRNWTIGPSNLKDGVALAIESALTLCR
jgi:hypothetical protein